MRIVDLLLGRTKERAPVYQSQPPAAIPAHERQQLAEAQVRITAKWKTFDDMIRDYDGQARALRRIRR